MYNLGTKSDTRFKEIGYRIVKFRTPEEINLAKNSKASCIPVTDRGGP
jgi:hypothetical protein